MKALFEEKNKIYTYAWSLVILLGFGYLLFIGFLRYETNDDFFLSIFTSGFLGEYNPHTVHNNYVLGILIALISGFTSAIHLNGSILFYVVEIIIAYFVFTYRIVKERNARGIIESLIFIFLSITSIMNKHNYSKTGALVLIVGAYTLATYKAEESKLIKLIAYILIISGGAYRSDTTIAVLPFVIICFAYGFRDNRDLAIKKYIIEWCICFGLILIMWGCHYHAYNANDSWKDFTEFNNLRESLIDYGIPDWNEHQDEYNAIGWSQNDCQFLAEWNFADNTTYNNESFKAVNSIGKDTRSLLSIRRMLHTVKVAVFSIPGMVKYCIGSIWFWIIITESIVCLIKNKSKWIAIIITDLFIFGELFYLFFAGRTPERAVAIPMLCGIVTLFLFNENRLHIVYDIVILGIVIVLCGVYKFPSMGKKNMPLKADMNGFLQELSAQENNLYVWDIFTFAEAAEKAYAPLDELPYGLFSNSTFLGGWIIPSPVFVEKCDKWGDGNNLVKLLTENENVYYISDDYPTEAMLRYIDEHYGLNIQPNLVEEYGRFKVFSFVE